MGWPRRTALYAALAMTGLLAGCGSSSATPAAGLVGQPLGPTAAASGSEATAGLARCRIDQTTWRTCHSPFVAFGLTPGAHEIDVEPTHGGVRLLRRPASATGDRVALVAFANTSGGQARAQVSFTVGGSPSGSVALTGLTAGASVRGLVPVGASPHGGGSRVVLVDYYVDGRIAATAASAPWDALIDSTRLSSGSHSVRAVAVTLNRRRRASAAISVQVAPSEMKALDAASMRNLQAAVDALGPEGGTLRLPAGRFPVSELRIGSGVRLVGAGAAETVLVAPAGDYQAALHVTGKQVLVSDLTIDASGTGSVSDQSAAIAVDNADDVVLRRLRLIHLKGYGVHMLEHHARISLQQSTLDGDGRALSGVAEWAEDARSADISVVRCVVRNMREYGVLLQSFFNGSTWPHPRALAYGNDVSQIHDTKIHDGTIEIGIWITGANAAALDNVVRNTGWDGIETVVNATRPTIAGNVVRGTRTGIYIENVTRDALIEDNDIARVSIAGINLEPPHGGPVSGRLTIRRNRVVGAGVYGIGTGPGTFGSKVTQNQVFDSGKMAILLQGASGNVIEDNDLRDRRTTPRQTWCVYDPQTKGTTTKNQVDGNDCTGSKNGGSSDLARYSARRGATS